MQFNVSLHMYVCLAVMLNCIKIYDWRNRLIYQGFKSGYCVLYQWFQKKKKKWSKNEVELVYLCTKIHKVW